MRGLVPGRLSCHPRGFASTPRALHGFTRRAVDPQHGGVAPRRERARGKPPSRHHACGFSSTSGCLTDRLRLRAHCVQSLRGAKHLFPRRAFPPLINLRPAGGWWEGSGHLWPPFRGSEGRMMASQKGRSQDPSQGNARVAQCVGPGATSTREGVEVPCVRIRSCRKQALDAAAKVCTGHAGT